MEPSRTDTPRRARRLLVAALFLGLVGVGLAAALTDLHARAHAGVSGPSFCSIDPAFDCDAVARSRFSVVAGVPVALWGLLWYAVVCGLALSGLRARRPHAAWPAGVLVALSSAAVAASVALAVISEAVLRTTCLLCAGAWIVNAALFVVVLALARSGGGVRRAAAADVSALRSRPAVAGVALAAVLAAAAAMWTLYPRLGPAKRAQPMQWDEGAARRIPLPSR